MDISAQMLTFATVVERGSISAAARTIGQTPSAVSKQIGLLEDQVHYRLLNRTRTGVTPTQEGQEFYEKCKAMAEKYKEAEALILNLDGTPRGMLKIASSVAFGKSQLIPVLPKFLEDHPEVQVSLELTDRVVDLQSEGFDATQYVSLNSAKFPTSWSVASCKAVGFCVLHQPIWNVAVPPNVSTN